ncbi:NACHT domain- and WD repeat-containing protein 1-like [Glandiceps talaboti]
MSDVASQLLNGRLGTTLPPLRSRVVRIFTSSTFTDTSVERNALMRDVYPKLKDYCKSKYGLEFQVVDMRWGVRDEATDDHMTSELCMNEIAACQKLSTGPNFVTFLCQKYGYRPFPPKILANELEAMRKVLIDNRQPVSTLDEWFRKDTNAVPPVYILQPISSKLVHFTDHANPDKMAADRNTWWQVFETLQGQLKYAAVMCERKKIFNAKQADKFRISVTHDEVIHGILGAAGTREDHCLCFIRKFNNLEQQAGNREAKNFIDIDWATNKVDQEAKQLLTNLRDGHVPRALKQSNVIVSTLNNWSEKGIDLNIPEHKQYLANFLKRFTEMTMALIDRAAQKDQGHISNDSMYDEILQHLTFCKFKCQSFHGREDVLSAIKGYVNERFKGNQGTASPLVIHGESGSGKTSVMAKAAFQTASEWFGRSNCAVVVRFLGTTPASTGVRQLLRSICQQVLTIYGHGETTIPDDYFKTVRWFTQVLRYASKERPLVIFLDSLDQLSAAEGAHRLTWLPRVLPPHAAVILSTLPKEHNLLFTLQYILSPGTTGYVQVKPLSVADSMKIMTSWLQTEKRTVNRDQNAIIADAIQQCSLPLFLKLLFDQSSRWQSYMSTSAIKVTPSVKGMISLIFDRLEEYHGQMLVSRALGYMTISQNGIAEAELEDILSLDDEVLQDVYAYWLPPTRRIPPLLWTRIRAEINDYLVEREAEGARVIYWYHRQFIEAARERYLHDEKIVKKMHKTCSDYYIGTWSGGKKKPFEYTPDQIQKFGVPKNAEEDRKVAPQPLEFGTNQKRFNIRKLEQLPFHEIHTQDVNHLKEYTLCSLQFLLAKLRGMGLGEVIQDFSMALAKYEDDDELRLVSDTLRVGASAVRENPFNLIVEVIGRLKNAKGKYIQMLVAQAEKETTNTVPLIPYNQCFPPAGGLLRTQFLGHSDEVLCAQATSDGRYLVTGSKDLQAIVWELESSTILHTLEGHHMKPICDIAITPDNLMAVTYNYKAAKKDDRSSEINVWNIETGQLFLKLPGHTGEGKVRIRFSSDSKFAVCTMTGYINVDSWNTEAHYYAKGWGMEDGRELSRGLECHKGKINDALLARASNGRHLLLTCGDSDDPAIKIWDFFTGQLLKEMLDRRRRQNHPTECMEVSSNGRHVAFSFFQHALLDVHKAEIIDLTSEEDRSSCQVRFLNNREVMFKQVDKWDAYIYDVEQLKLVKRINLDGIRIKHFGSLLEVLVTDDFKTVVSRHDDANSAVAWKVVNKAKSEVDRFECAFQAKLPHDGLVKDACIVNSQPSVFAVTASTDNSIKVWNIDNIDKALQQERENRDQGVLGGVKDDSRDNDDESKKPYYDRMPYLKHITYRARTLEDEKYVAVLDNVGKMLSLYDVMAGTLVGNEKWTGYEPAGGIDATADGKKLFAQGGRSLMEYDATTLKPVYEKMKKLDLEAKGLRISPHGSSTVFIGGNQHMKHVYTYDIENHWYMGEFDPKTVTKAMFLLSGDRILLACANNLTMITISDCHLIYDQQFVPGMNGYGDYILCATVTKNERWLITGWQDGSVKLFDVQTGVGVKKFNAHTGPDESMGTDEDVITEINLSSTDQFFVTGSSDKTARMWDLASLRLIHIFQGHNNAVMMARISGDNQFVLTVARNDLNVKVHSTSSGYLLTNIIGYTSIDNICILPKANRILITTTDNRVMFFKVNQVIAQQQRSVRPVQPAPPPAQVPAKKKQSKKSQKQQTQPTHQVASGMLDNVESSFCTIL